MLKVNTTENNDSQPANISPESRIAALELELVQVRLDAANLQVQLNYKNLENAKLKLAVFNLQQLLLGVNNNIAHNNKNDEGSFFVRAEGDTTSSYSEAEPYSSILSPIPDKHDTSDNSLSLDLETTPSLTPSFNTTKEQSKTVLATQQDESAASKSSGHESSPRSRQRLCAE